MRILVVGSGGVGAAFAPIAARRDFYERVVFADHHEDRAAASIVDDRHRPVLGGDGGRAGSDRDHGACRAEGTTYVLNAVDPRFVMPIHRNVRGRCHYLDMALSLSEPHRRSRTASRRQVKDAQFAQAAAWRNEPLALVGMGVEPGLSDVFALRPHHLFDRIDEVDVRDGADLAIRIRLRLSFDLTTIEECLTRRPCGEGAGWYTLPPFSEPETFTFPGGSVRLIASTSSMTRSCRSSHRLQHDVKYGLGDEFIDVLKTLHKLGLDATDLVDVRGRASSARRAAACLPDSAGLGPKMSGKTCAGTRVTGTGTDGNAREVYLYHVVDNEETWGRDRAQAVVWQTAVNPVVALELLGNGSWSGTGVLGPEAFEPTAFLELLNDYGSPWGIEERVPTA
jgi:saccharopine dehydrogenase-like NADP-dependent oxidoreductase